MTTPSRPRPMSDYKKTVLMMDYIRQYDELSVALLALVEELKAGMISDDELDRLNTALETMAEEMQTLVDLITQHGGNV